MPSVLVTCADAATLIRWGIDPQRVAEPFLILPEGTPVRDALARARDAWPAATHVAYADPDFLTKFFSHHYLYEGALHRWISRAAPNHVVFRRIHLDDTPADLVGGPVGDVAELDPMAASTHTGEIEIDLLRDDPRAKTLVFGDSHVFNLYTEAALIGMRGVIVQPVVAGGIEQLKVSRHIGGVTMHRLAERGEITANFFRHYGLRPGDRVVAVCGEVDVRNHVGRVAAAQGVPVAEVVRDLCERFCNTLQKAVAGFGPLEVVLSCPTPPLDLERVRPDNRVEHWGTLAERIAANDEMCRQLSAQAARRGWLTIDLREAFRDSSGALDFDRSDLYCHVAHAHKAPAIAAVHRLMGDRPPRPVSVAGMRRVSPELEFLACLCRPDARAPDLARARDLSASLDWNRVRALASHHGVTAFVSRNLGRAAFPAAPASFAAQLRSDRLVAARDDLQRYGEWLRLCRVFDAAGIPALTLKGFHVALALYGEIGLRPVTDLDFLVRPADVPAVLGVLEREGYVLTADWRAAIRHVGLDHVVRTMMEIGLSRGGVIVDLHWRVGTTGVPGTDELMATAVRLPVEGGEVLVPEPMAALALLILHGDKSAWGRLRWLIDVAIGLERFSAAELDALVHRLQRLRRPDALGNALRLMRDLWGSPPVGTADLTSKLPVQLRTQRYAWAMLERQRDWAHLFDPWRPFRMLVDRFGRMSSLRQAIVTAVRPNQFDWASVQLPRGFRLGYYVVRPIRLLAAAMQPSRPDSQAPPVAKEGMSRVDAATGRESMVPPFRTPATTACTLVTAIYPNGPRSEFGGRGWDVSYYASSLVNLAHLGAPVIVFCPPDDVPRVTAAIAPFFERYRVVGYSLRQFAHVDAALALKAAHRKSMIIDDRNEVLCFLKSYWVQAAINANPFGHERFFWIDAGLTHHGIIPERLGGVELRRRYPASHYHPVNQRNVFTPRLGTALAAAPAPGTVLFCGMPYASRVHPPGPYEEVAASTLGVARDSLRLSLHLAGGLFGGHRDDLQALHRMFDRLLKAFLDAGVYTREEQVFSALHASDPERFTIHAFDTWRHDSPGESTSHATVEGKPYYRIFTSLASEAPGDATVATVGRTYATHGVTVALHSNHDTLLDRMAECLPPGSMPEALASADVAFSLVRVTGEGGRVRYLLRDGDAAADDGFRLQRVMETLESAVRLRVGAAAPDRLFVHAGAVAWKGQGIIIPGRSGTGKTSLVAALVRAGATYCSDEYALLDAHGRLHPYPRRLSVRRGEHRRIQASADHDLGGQVQGEPVAVRCIVHTRFRDGGEWNPVVVSAGASVLSLFANTLAARERASFAMGILTAAAAGALSVTGDRGDADETASRILRFVEANPVNPQPADR